MTLADDWLRRAGAESGKASPDMTSLGFRLLLVFILTVGEQEMRELGAYIYIYTYTLYKALRDYIGYLIPPFPANQQ